MAADCGAAFVAGVDEAGRGALAGPVFAAAVILPLDDITLTESLHEVNDSKLLSPAVRDALFPLICRRALAFAVGQAAAATVDQMGILPATHLAMLDAIAGLPIPARALVIDGPIRLATTLPQRAVIRGDQRCLSIAAASVLAKVSRDRYMVALDGRLTGYGFARHKGYGTAKHRLALARLGPCAEHRRSFAPVRELLESLSLSEKNDIENAEGHGEARRQE